MTFEVPESKASLDQNRFKFKIGARSYTVPKAKFMSIEDSFAIEMGDGEALLNFFGREGSSQGKAIRGLDREQWDALLEAWKQDSGIGVGESEASSS